MELASVVIYVDDGTVAQALAFYENALGLTRRFYDPEFQFGELCGATGTATLAIAAHAAAERLMPIEYRRPAPGTPVTNAEVAFTTADVRGAFDRAMAAGATLLAAPYITPWGQQVAYVRAPDGTLVGLCAPISAAPPG